MALTAKNHCCKVLRGLQDLRKNNTLCDYSLKADNFEMKVHKVVMASCSDYFRVMLTGEMRESREGAVELKGVTASGLRRVVDFAYTGNIELTSENVEDVLAAATHLQVNDAVELCSKYLEATITVDNCVDILNLAEMYSLISTHDIAREFMLENFELVADSDQYYKLNHIQMSSMLSENCLKVVSEYRLFNLVIRWISYNMEQREQYVAELMKNVRLSLLSGEELVDKVSKVEIMRRNQTCCELLTEAKDYHIVVSKQPLNQNCRTHVRSDRQCLVMCHAENLESYVFSSKKHGFLKDSMIPLFNPGVTVIDNFIYACGGKYDNNENSEIATARCFRYDPRFDSWFELTSMNEARKDFSLIGMDKKIYAIAGQDENVVMCTMECFNISNNEWQLKSPLNHSVYGHAGAVCQGKIYISGGQRFSGCCNNVICYDPDGDSWEEKAPMLNARLNHVMLSVNDKLYVLGGNIEDGYGFPVPVITIEIYNPGINQWCCCKKTMNIREAGACVLDNKIYVVGGINGEHYFSDLVQSFDPNTDDVDVVDKFPTRIYGRACCISTLPQYV